MEVEKQTEIQSGQQNNNNHYNINNKLITIASMTGLLPDSKETQSNVISVDNNLPSSNDYNQRFDFLTGIRGMLAIIVMVYHYIFLPFANNDYRLIYIEGVIAVAGFFVLSAFLLTNKLIQQFEANVKQQSDSKSIKLILAQYFVRRFFRIFPLYILDLILIIQINPIGCIEITWQDFFKYILLFRVYACWLWTIQPEFLWYFFIPIAAWFVVKSERLWWLFTLLLVLGSTSFFYFTWSFNRRADEQLYLMSGTIMGIIYSKIKRVQLANDNLITKYFWESITLLFGLFGYLFFVFAFDPDAYNNGPYIQRLFLPSFIALYFPTWWIMLLLTGQTKTVQYFGNKNSFFYWAGELSYSIYMLHRFSQHFILNVIEFDPKIQILQYMSEVAITLILAQISYKFFETKFMKWGEDINKSLANSYFFRN